MYIYESIRIWCSDVFSCSNRYGKIVKITKNNAHQGTNSSMGITAVWLFSYLSSSLTRFCTAE